MPFVSKRANLLERSLQGLASTDPEVRNLVATAARIPSLTSRASAPRDEFVSALGLQLRAEALARPARAIVSDSRQVEGRSNVERRSARRPLVFVIGRGMPRILAGATLSLLVVAAIVGGTSRSSLPGGLLYPVKQVLDSAAVQLAGSDFDRGVTLLSQAQEHISDAGALVERDGANSDPAEVNQALLGAHDTVTAGQRALLGEFDRTGNPQAFIAVQDFVVRSVPQLNALRPVVPPASRPAVDSLLALLQETRTTLARKIAVCGQPCASLGGSKLGSTQLSTPSTGPLSAPTQGGVLVPGVGVPGGVGAPGATAAITGPGGVVVAPVIPPRLVGGQLLPTSTGGIRVIVPSVPVPSVTLAPIPGVSAPLPLP